MDGEWHFVEAHFEGEANNLTGGLDFRFDHSIVTFLDTLSVDDAGQVQFGLAKDGAPLTFTGQIQNEAITGQAKHGEQSGPFKLSRVYDLDMDIHKAYIGNYQLGERIILLNRLQDRGIFQYFDTAARRQVEIYPLDEITFFSELGETITVITGADGKGEQLVWQTQDGNEMIAPRAKIYDEEEVRYPNGEMTLAGTLLLPSTPGPYPAIVLMHCTGPNNRDYYRILGHAFVSKGIAALVYDKPGAFDSAHPSLDSTWENSVQDLADAALAGVNYLQHRPEINVEQVGIWTVSNSFWAGPLAASQSDDVAFIISTAASGVAQRQADVFQEDLNNVSYYDYPNWAAKTAFNYLKFTREFSIFAREYNLPIPAPVRDYYGQDFDPLTAWSRISQPVLVINGQYDTLLDPVDGVARFEQALSQNGTTDYTLVVIPGADHGLRLTDTGLKPEGFGERDRVFAPGVMELMTGWVLDRFDGQQITARQVQDVSSPVPVKISDHFEPGGRYELLPWYGQPEFQVGLWLVFSVVWLSALLVWPVAAIINLVRRRAVGRGPGLARLVGWIVSLLSLFLFVGLILTWVQIVHLSSGAFFGFPEWLNILPVLAPVAVLLILIAIYFAVQAWRKRYWSVIGRVHYTVVTTARIFFVWYLAYWQLL